MSNLLELAYFLAKELALSIILNINMKPINFIRIS